MAILGDLFLKTNEVSIEINDCIKNVKNQQNSWINSIISENDAEPKVHNFDNILVTNQMKSKIPFDFVKSRSEKCFINLLLFAIAILNTYWTSSLPSKGWILIFKLLHACKSLLTFSASSRVEICDITEDVEIQFCLLYMYINIES